MTNIFFTFIYFTRIGCFIKNTRFSWRQWKRTGCKRETLPRYGYKVLVDSFTRYRHGAYVVPTGRWCHLPYCSCDNYVIAREIRGPNSFTKWWPELASLVVWSISLDFFLRDCIDVRMSTKTHHEQLLNNIREEFAVKLVNLT